MKMETGVAVGFVLLWAAMILIPCAVMGWMGYRLITRLGQYPSKTALMQKNIMLPYIVVAVASMTAILVFFRVMTAAD